MRPFRGVIGSNRSQSTTLGVALLFAIVVLGMAAVVVMAVGPITTAENSIAIDRAEQTLTQLDAQMAKVALGKSNGQSIDLGEARSGYQVDSDAGWIKVKRAGGTNPLPKTPLGAIYYERGDTELAYQGGGVWKRTKEGGMRMISPPEFHYRDGTLTLPLISLSSSDGTYEGRTSLTQASAPVQKFPSGAATNPVPAGVTVVVKSEYYKAWGKYFRERTEGIVRYDHGKNKAMLRLVTPIGNKKVKNAMAALNSNGEFTLSGSAGKRKQVCGSGNTGIITDSYDSSTGSYCSQSRGHNGDLIYGGRITLAGSGNSQAHGLLKTDEIECQGTNCNKVSVFGDVKTNKCLTSDGDTEQCDNLPESGYTYDDTARITTVSPLDSFINRKVDGLADENDNDKDFDGDGTADPDISSEHLSFGGDSKAVLGPGSYYLQELEFSGGDKLVLDTSKRGGGPIRIAVENYVDVASNTIKVKGTNHVEIYVKGASPVPCGSCTTDWEFSQDKGGKVLVPGDRSPQLRIFGKKSFSAAFGNRGPDSGGGGSIAEFVGVIYAPTGSSGSGTVRMDHTHIFGGIVTGDTFLEVKSSIHYDEALKSTQIINPNAKIARITYLHISVSEVKLDN